MTFAAAVPILFTSFVYRTNVYWSVIHGIKRKPHLSVVWNWYHFVAIAILHQLRPTDSADINTRLQLSDTSSIPPMHGGFLLLPWTSKGYSMEFHGTLASTNKKSPSSMGFHGIRRAPFQMTQSVPWNSRELWSPPNEISLSSMEFHGIFHGIPWNFGAAKWNIT